MNRNQIVALLLLAMSLPAKADEEPINEKIVVTGNDGTCFAESIPSEPGGPKGWTTIFQAGEKGNAARDRYNWYANDIYLQCHASDHGEIGITVVRIGPWASGRNANKSDLALAFYRNGRLLKSYSTLDIAVKPHNVWRTASHYRVISSVGGFQRQKTGQIAFEVTRTDGNRLWFSSSGQLVRRD